MLAMLSGMASADGIDYIVVEKTDASSTQVALSDFNQIKFNDTQMLMVNNGATIATYQLKDLRRMYFGPTESTRIEETEWDASSQVEIYSMSGILLKRGDLDMQSLPNGIYIVRQGTRVMKVSKK